MSQRSSLLHLVDMTRPMAHSENNRLMDRTGQSRRLPERSSSSEPIAPNMQMKVDPFTL
jgi:hypothetical protein